MAHVGTLWGGIRQPQTKVIRSVAALNELELKQPEWVFANKPAEFTTKFTYGKIPAFEGTDGFKLIEGVAIARYLCGLSTKVNLLGSNAKEIALVDQWVHFAEAELGVPGYAIGSLIFGFGGPFNRETLDEQVGRLVRGLDYVESHLATCSTSYLVCDSVTLADLVLAGIAYGAGHAALGAAERAKYPSLYAHYEKVTGDERVKHLWGTEGFVEVAAREPRPLPVPTKS